MQNTLSPGFMILHGNRPELLRDLLIHWYREHPLAPLEDEVILVQSNGMAQWLKLALAQGETEGFGAAAGMGIAAAFDLQLPARFAWRIYRALLGHEAVPGVSPFDKSPLTWRLMRLLPELLADPAYAPLAGFLADDNDRRKRYQLAQKIADLFDQYQVYRADWLDAWAAGHNTLPDMSRLGEAVVLEDAQCWQAHLWRALREDVRHTEGEWASQTSRAALHQRFRQAAAQCTQRPEGWPRRVTVFGMSTLPRQFLDVLHDMSRHTQIMLCVHNPCEHYWADLQGEREIMARALRQQRRSASGASVPRAGRVPACAGPVHDAHPLLASWGRQGRDYIALLDEMDEPAHYQRWFARIGHKIDLWESPQEGVAHPGLLHWLQDDIFQLRSVAESRDLWAPDACGGDESLRFHIVHSPQREVEVLHDALLAAFDQDATLQPRDVIIMVPDIQGYAPHIEAVFGQVDRTDARYISYSIADLGVRHQAPLVFALAFLLGLPDSRLAVSDVFDLLDVPAVRRRFAIDADDLPLLRQWVRQTHIRWGLNAAHRSRLLGQDQSEDQNTWQHGLKQMLLGYAIGESSCGATDGWHGIEPYGEVAGLSAGLAGCLARLLEELDRFARLLSEPVSPERWEERLKALLATFFECDAPEEEVLWQQMQRRLEEWRAACESAGLQEALPLEVVREHWMSQMDQPGLGQRFMAGRVTFATLMPMRAIPYRWIGLLGMNDGDYPRSHPPLDFDLMARAVRPGDRSRREDDRYLFLEALLSARQHLHISWVGRSIIDHAERPPSVLVSQLRDHIVRCWPVHHVLQGEGVLASMTVTHRLQAFSPDYFHAPDDTPDRHFYTYAHEWERRADLSGQRETQASLSPSPLRLPAALNAPVTLGQLSRFLKNPARLFFRERLGVHYEADDLASVDQEPFGLDSLASWSLQDQLITSWMNGYADENQDEPDEADDTRLLDREMGRFQRQGILPIGAMGQRQKMLLQEPLGRMFSLYKKAREKYKTALEDIDFVYEHVKDELRIEIQGTITHRYAGEEGDVRIGLLSSNLLKGSRYCKEKLLDAWVVHLAAHLVEGGRPTQTILVGKNGQVDLPLLTHEEAQLYFSQIVDAYLEGLCAPLPLAPKTGFALLESAAQARTVSKVYEGDAYNDGEVSRNEYLRRAYPDYARLAADGALLEWSRLLLEPLTRHLGKKGAQT